MKTNTNLIENILHARYSPDVKFLLEEYQKDSFSDKEKVNALLQALLTQLRNLELQYCCPIFPYYIIPPETLQNNQKVRNYIINILEKLDEDNENNMVSFAKIQEFFERNHESIKWSQNQWLLASPGLNLELFTISTQLHPQFFQWLNEKFGLKIGDDVVHQHVISTNGRRRLREMGFTIMNEHWHEKDYRDGMKLAVDLVSSTDQCKGLFCDSSWVFNPDNFKIASDGKPYVSFIFLKDDKLVGHRIEITDLILKKDFETQYNFALRNERRRKLEEKGEFKVKVYGTFYPKEELLKNKEYFIPKVSNL